MTRRSFALCFLLSSCASNPASGPNDASVVDAPDAAMLDVGPTDADVPGLARSLCDELGESFGATWVNCLGGDPLAHDLYASEYACLGLEELASEIARGWVAVDADALAACHARWRAGENCDDAISAFLTFGFRDARNAISQCDGALVARQELGEPCAAPRDCANDLDCFFEFFGSRCVGTCTPYQERGEACGVELPECAYPLVCRDPLCGPRRTIGDPCDEADTSDCYLADGWCDLDAGLCRAYTIASDGDACGSGTRCADPLLCLPLMDGTARCGASAGDGEPCRDDEDCAESLGCDRGVFPALGVCRPRVPLGESCGEVRCEDGLWCFDSLCVPPGELGEPCHSPFSGSRTSSCVPSLICDDEVCREPRYLGEACAAGVGLCVAGRCAEGRCAIRLDLGAPCATGDECRSGTCAEGRCVDSERCMEER
jgi:hypothetical protein